MFEFKIFTCVTFDRFWTFDNFSVDIADDLWKMRRREFRKNLNSILRYFHEFKVNSSSVIDFKYLLANSMNEKMLSDDK